MLTNFVPLVSSFIVPFSDILNLVFCAAFLVWFFWFLRNIWR